MSDEEEQSALLGTSPSHNEDVESQGLTNGSRSSKKQTEKEEEDEADVAPQFGKCIVLTLDIFNSFSLLLGGLLLAVSIYIKQIWDKGISGEEIFSHFFAWVGVFLCLVSFAGFVCVRLVNNATTIRNDNESKDIIYNVSNRHHRQNMKRHAHRLIFMVYIIILLCSIIAQFFLSGILLVFVDSISKQYLTPRLSPSLSPNLHNNASNSYEQQQHYSPVMKISSNLLFVEVYDDINKRKSKMLTRLKRVKKKQPPKAENELRIQFNKWSKCTYTRCCEWKKFHYDENVQCASKLKEKRNATKQPKEGDNNNLPTMCKGWPISKEVCSSGIKKFQKQSAIIIERYIQPVITFLMFNAFLQLIVMVLAILEICTVYAQYKNQMRLNLN
jgi:hypothetical protein